MGLIHGVQPPVIEDGIEYHSVRAGGAAEGSAPLVWFQARHIESGLIARADEVSGRPGVMSLQRATGEAGKGRLKDKIAKLVEEFTE